MLAVAQNDYNPSNPPEPSKVDYCVITVTADPTEGAYVSGGGKYKVTGGSVYISTSAKNTEDYTYQFQYWTLNGEIYSYSRYFYYYCRQGGEMNFVAHYTKTPVVFDPKNPAEPSPSTAKRKYYLYLNPSLENSCSFNISSGNKYEEGASVYLRVYPNAYYKFEGWKVDGNIISTSTSFYYYMPSATTTIEAVMSEIPYDPANPMEPTGSGQTDVDNRDIATEIYGHCVAKAEAGLYDLTGRKVTRHSDGIYIKNGRKVLFPAK